MQVPRCQPPYQSLSNVRLGQCMTGRNWDIPVVNASTYRILCCRSSKPMSKAVSKAQRSFQAVNGLEGYLVNAETLKEWKLALTVQYRGWFVSHTEMIWFFLTVALTIQQGKFQNPCHQKHYTEAMQTHTNSWLLYGWSHDWVTIQYHGLQTGWGESSYGSMLLEFVFYKMFPLRLGKERSLDVSIPK